jgi:lysyl-tRNA synthetase class 2
LTSDRAAADSSTDEVAASDDDGVGRPSVPYRFPGTSPIASVTAGRDDLQAGESSGDVVTVAGRIMLSRPQGRLAFAELRDWTGSVQLFAVAASSERFDELVKLNLGDWIGVTGEVVRTKRGEVSVQVANWTLLAEARVGFGDKWRGVHDVEVRYRQREVDLWANEGVRDTFLLRSRVVSTIRRRLDARGYVEVETPVLQPLAGGAIARPFVTHFNALHADFYLRIAPELYLKRLIVGGFERVYELGRDFRNEGLSPRHNPEFTMLEAYQAYADYSDMAELVEDLVAGTASEVLGTTSLTYQGRAVDLSPPWRRATLSEVIAEVTGVECDMGMSVEELRTRAASLAVAVEAGWGPGRIIYEIYERTTEHELWGPVHVMDYPEEVSPLVRSHRSKPGVVERMTPIVGGREIAEIYSELTDPDIQRARLVAQAAARDAGDDEAMVVDEEFLRALGRGMPPTGGIGVGIDRLVMLFADVASIREVLLFPALRPEHRAAGDEIDAGGPEQSRAREPGEAAAQA